MSIKCVHNDYSFDCPKCHLLNEAREAERLAARKLAVSWDKYNNEPYGVCSRAEFDAYVAACKRVDELEGK